MVKDINKGFEDLEKARRIVNRVLKHIPVYDDTLMDCYFEAVYGVMKEFGYSQDDVDFITENE